MNWKGCGRNKLHTEVPEFGGLYEWNNETVEASLFWVVVWHGFLRLLGLTDLEDGTDVLSWNQPVLLNIASYWKPQIRNHKSLRFSRDKPVMIVGLWARILTLDLLNTKQKSCALGFESHPVPIRVTSDLTHCSCHPLCGWDEQASFIVHAETAVYVEMLEHPQHVP